MNEAREQTLTTADVATAAEPETEEQVRRKETEAAEAQAQERPAAPAEEWRAKPEDRPAPGKGPESAPLFPGNEAEGFRSRWNSIQTAFVDEPRRAVEQADGLVAEMIKRLAQVFADERAKLEEQWGRGDDISTEDLPLTLQRYRSF